MDLSCCARLHLCISPQVWNFMPSNNSVEIKQKNSGADESDNCSLRTPVMMRFAVNILSQSHIVPLFLHKTFQEAGRGFCSGAVAVGVRRLVTWQTVTLADEIPRAAREP